MEQYQKVFDSRIARMQHAKSVKADLSGPIQEFHSKVLPPVIGLLVVVCVDQLSHEKSDKADLSGSVQNFYSKVQPPAVGPTLRDLGSLHESEETRKVR